MPRSLSRILLGVMVAALSLPLVPASPAAAMTPTKIMLLGDSITEGLTGSHASVGDFSGNETWPTYRHYLVNELNAASGSFDFVGTQSGAADISGGPGVNDTDTAITGFGTWDQNHEGHQSWRADQVISNPPFAAAGTVSAWIATHNPDVVVINLGANDIIQNQSPTNVRDEIVQIIGILRAQNPNVDIVVTTLIDLVHPMNGNAQADVDALNVLIRALPGVYNTANSRVVLADIANGFNGATMNTDNIHPNASGGQHMAGIIRAALINNGLVATAAGNQAPVAVFYASCVGATCTFNGADSNDPDGSVASYSWNFGDGTSGTGSSTSRTYTSGGPFTATLTVTDNGGATHATSQTVTPAVSNASPVAAFTFACTGATCTFNGSSSSDSGGWISAYNWNFGDGTTGTGVSLSHTYSAAGAKSVTLTVTDNSGASTPTSNSITIPACTGGYWLLESDGDVYNFGNASDHGEPGNTGVNLVDIQANVTGCGYWTLRANGEVRAFGDAAVLPNFDLSALGAGEKIASFSATASGNGLWGFTNRGRVLLLGDARHGGDLLHLNLNGEIIDSITTPTGNGYYMLGSDGGIFTFGDAVFINSLPALVGALNEPAVGLVPDPDGNGYWIVAADGGVFAIEAPYRGSFPGLKLGPLNKPGIGMVAYGDGYLMVATDGGVFNFSNLAFNGSLGANPPNTDIVAITPLP
ncbi:MAG: PKD repeat protein [Candidatus Poriferisodalaceae bacterium]|jgi:PKD repeat protein